MVCATRLHVNAAKQTWWRLSILRLALLFLIANFDSINAGERYAFLVGVNKYDPAQLNSLQYAESDVEELADVLVEAGYKPDNVVRMTLKSGTKEPRYLPDGSRIRKELTLLLNNLTKDDSIIIALAGHGVQYVDTKKAYFCPQDAKLSEVDSLIAIEDLQKQLTECKGGVKLLLVDACRNDPQAESSRAAGTVFTAHTPIIQQTAPQGILAFYSCNAGERAWEHVDLKHGVFFYYLIQGLKGGAIKDSGKEVTVGGLQEFVSNNVKGFVRAKYGASQKPELLTKGDIPVTASLAVWAKSAPPVRADSAAAMFDPEAKVNWSPPGGEYKADLYSSKEKKISRVTLLRRLTQNKLADQQKMEPTQALISDDGSKIAFWVPKSGLFTINFDGTGLTPVATSLEQNREPDLNWLRFSPDAKTLYYQVFGSPLYRIGVDGSNKRPLVLQGAEYEPFRLREDGQRIYYSTRAGIYSIDTYGNSDYREHVTQDMILKKFDQPGALFGTFDVNESGTRLVFLMHHPKLKKRQAFVINTDGSGLRALVETEFEPTIALMTPQGDRVMLNHYAGKTYLVDWDGTNLTEFKCPPQYGENGYGHGGVRRFSKDGNWFTHSQADVGPQFTSVHDSDHRHFEPIATDVWNGLPDGLTTSFGLVSFSADFRRFAYVTNVNGRPRQLVAGEINPTSRFAPAPLIKNVAFPARLSAKENLPNHVGLLTCGIEAGLEPVEKVRFLGSPVVQFGEDHKDPNQRWKYGAGRPLANGTLALNDEGKTGDVAAKDGTYSTQIVPWNGNLQLPPRPTKFQIRIIAETENTQVQVDVDGTTITP